MNAFVTLTHVLAALPAAPDPSPKAPPGFETLGNDVLGWIKWAGLIVGIGSLMIVGIRMAAGQRNRSHGAVEAALHLPYVFIGLTIVSLAASLVATIVK